MKARWVGFRLAALVVVTSVAVSACGATSSPASGSASLTAISSPTAVATTTTTAPPLAAATPSAGPSAPTSFSSVIFDKPFTIALPPGWILGDQVLDMSALFLPLGPSQGPRLGIDVQEVPKVFKDPCDPQSALIQAGTSPGDLATWMRTWAPLHASAPIAAKVSGLDAVMIEEGFAGTTTCPNANLWPTSGGYLDPQEHKRYYVVDVGGKRVVVTLVGRDDTWAATLKDGLAELDTLKFTTK